ADGRRHRVARAFDQSPRLAALGMHRGRISGQLQRAQHRRLRLGAEGGGGVVIRVDSGGGAHTPALTPVSRPPTGRAALSRPSCSTPLDEGSPPPPPPRRPASAPPETLQYAHPARPRHWPPGPPPSSGCPRRGWNRP